MGKSVGAALGNALGSGVSDGIGVGRSVGFRVAITAKMDSAFTDTLSSVCMKSVNADDSRIESSCSRTFVAKASVVTT